MRRLFFLICLVYCQPGMFAQEPLIYDSSALAIRNIPEGKLNSYKKDEAFQYERIAEPSKSLWNRFWTWFWGKVGEILRTEAGKVTVKTIAVLLAIAILVFTLLKLTGITSAGLFGKGNNSGSPGYIVTPEDIHGIDFENAIQQAVEDKNYRVAVRLLYLQSLKHLTDRGLIRWKINKTNIAYLKELDNTSFQNVFRDLTLQFESNWYGGIPIAENEFDAVRRQFTIFNQQLL